jgi:hypothetical protein
VVELPQDRQAGAHPLPGAEDRLQVLEEAAHLCLVPEEDP